MAKKYKLVKFSPIHNKGRKGKRYRVWNGRRYDIVDCDYTRKKDAEQVAGWYKKDGFDTKIIKTGGGIFGATQYELWATRKRVRASKHPMIRIYG